jgi:undecaprenyl-diphosphatase
MVLLIKFRIKRKRPEGEWGRVYRASDPHSFPSGHAARAFLLATIASGLGPPALAIFLWIWAPLVALARVAMGVHYLSDVVAGAFFGIIIALIGLQVYPPLFDWMFTVLGFSLW